MHARELRVRGEVRIECGPIDPLAHLMCVYLGPWPFAKPGAHALAKVLGAGVMIVELDDSLGGTTEARNGTTFLFILFIILQRCGHVVISVREIRHARLEHAREGGLQDV